MALNVGQVRVMKYLKIIQTNLEEQRPKQWQTNDNKAEGQRKDWTEVKLEITEELNNKVR